MEPAMEAAMEAAMEPAVEPAGQDAVQLEVVEGQLTWLVHIIGAVIRGRLSSSTAESQETIDGDLTARAFGLLQIVDSGYAAHAIQQCCWKMQMLMHMSIALVMFASGAPSKQSSTAAEGRRCCCTSPLHLLCLRLVHLLHCSCLHVKEVGHALS